jgi:hypothetical protein
MSNQEVVDFFSIKLGFNSYGNPVGGVSVSLACEICDDLLEFCMGPDKNAHDNLSVILVCYNFS